MGTVDRARTTTEIAKEKFMKLATTLLLGFLVSAAALAHPGGDGDRSGRRGPPVDRLAEHLGLDAYQTQQVEEILGASRSKGMEIMMAAREETRAKMALRAQRGTGAAVRRADPALSRARIRAAWPPPWARPAR
jgi:Spy/CpxP family protein refolding chaperone